MVDPIEELISRALPDEAPTWAAEVCSLLKEVKDMPPSEISGSVVLKDWLRGQALRVTLC